MSEAIGGDDGGGGGAQLDSASLRVDKHWGGRRDRGGGLGGPC